MAGYIKWELEGDDADVKNKWTDDAYDQNMPACCYVEKNREAEKNLFGGLGSGVVERVEAEEHEKDAESPLFEENVCQGFGTHRDVELRGADVKVFHCGQF